MDWVLYSIASIVAVFIIDATLGRWLLGLIATTFRTTRVVGGAPSSKRLLVYLPGILFDGDESVAEIKDALLAPMAQGLFVSYGFWRFRPRKVLKSTARAVGSPEVLDCTSLVLVGASFGGRFAADLAMELRTHYGWSAKQITVVMVDTPCENNSFQMPGLAVSLIMKGLYIGPLLSALAAPLVKLTLVPPYDVDIQGDLDAGLVKRTAVSRMAKFRLSSVADQQRYLADDSIQWTMGLSEVRVVYMMCDRNNITVVQPAAMRKVELFTKGCVGRFSTVNVPSPHCGFAQLPDVWSTAFAQAFIMERVGFSV